jgi:hypothetical protein
MEFVVAPAGESVDNLGRPSRLVGGDCPRFALFELILVEAVVDSVAEVTF